MKPILRGHSHQIMFFVSLGATLMLLSQAKEPNVFYSTLVYSIGLLSMFGISALYHRINWSPSQRAFMRKLDHSAIFLMIGGSFTPMCMLALGKDSGNTLLALIWGICAFGILKSLFFTNLPKILNAAIYIIAGYMIIPYTSELANSLGMTNVVLLILGGGLYTFGAIVYAFKKPNPFPKHFGYHEIFHLFVSIAAICHFLIVDSVVTSTI